MCLEAVVRTRFSKGYKISQFVTPVLISNVDLIVCPTLDSDQAFCFGLDMAEQVQGNNQALEEKKRVNDSFMFVQVRKFS